MTEIANLEDLFKHSLQDMYYAEKRIAQTLPKMAEKATHEDLQAALDNHLEETKDQITKLEEVFEICEYKKDHEKCEAIEGLIEEGEGLMNDAQKGHVLDLSLIAAAQKIEHYEIASYGFLCNIAKKLGYTDADTILNEILEQETATDEKLSMLCEAIEENVL